MTVSSRALIGACERLGIDTETLLRTVGISRETLEDPDARLQNSEAGALWTKAYELSGDPVLSLHAAECCVPGAYKVLDYIGANARTVGEGMRYVVRYVRLLNTAVSLSIDESGDPVIFQLADARGGPVFRVRTQNMCLPSSRCACGQGRVLPSRFERSRLRTSARPTSASTSGSSPARCASRPTTIACTSIG